MDYSKYSRSFIILDDKKSNFRNTNESIKGHIKIEIRNNQGTLRCIVQNLKYYEDGRFLYKLYFFGKKNNDTIFLNAGTLVIDKQGRAEHIYKFNPSNLDGKGKELYDYNLAAIIAQPNKEILEDDTIYPVMTGTLSKEKMSSGEEEGMVNAHEETDEPKMPDNTLNNEVPSLSSASSDESPSGSIPEKKILQPLQEDVYKKTFSTPKTEASPKTIVKKAFDTNRYFGGYVRAVSNNLENVLSFYNASEPFEYDKIGCTWWKVTNLVNIPFANTSYLQGFPDYMNSFYMQNSQQREFYPSCHDLIYKYQHYIFGIEHDKINNNKYYYYGIPGRYMKEEQPDNGKSGFIYWQPLKGIEKQPGDYGYWINCIDAVTGQFLAIEEA